jgi:hypothetical protein
MTKPKNRPDPLPVPPRPRAAPLPADTSQDDDAANLAALLAQFQGGGGYSVRIERMRDVGMRVELAGYLGVLPLGAELYDDTMQAWGGGKYRGRIFLGNEYQASITYQIAGEPRPRDASTFTGAGGEPSNLEKQLARLLDKLDAPPPPPNPLVQFAEIAKVIRELMPAPPAPVASDPMVMFKMMDTMLDLRARVQEDAPVDNGIATVVRDGIQPLIALVRERWDMDKTAQRLRATPENGTPARRSSAPTSDPILMLTSRIPALGRAYLAGAARNRSDPALYAELVLDQIPAADYDGLPALLSQPDFTARLLKAVPEFEPYPVWFGELVRAMYQSVTAEILVDAPESGDAIAADITTASELHATDLAAET